MQKKLKANNKRLSNILIYKQTKRDKKKSGLREEAKSREKERIERERQRESEIEREREKERTWNGYLFENKKKGKNVQELR